MALIVSFSGSDGSGKTTIAKLIQTELEKDGHNIYYHHELDFYILKGILHTLKKSPLGEVRSENLKSDFLTRVHRNTPFLSGLYYIAIFLDNLITYIYFKKKKGIIISDRWIYDYISGFMVFGYENSFISWLYSKFPRPDIYILFTVSPEIAMVRKKNDERHKGHGIEFYSNLSEAIEKTSKDMEYDGKIDADNSIEEVLNETINIITEKMN